MNLRNTQIGIEQLNARRAGKSGASPERSAVELLEQLLWETRQGNKMLWVALTDEQRAAYGAME